MSKYTIAGEEFQTLDDLRTRVKGILGAYPDYCFLSPEDLSFMLDLLQRHEHAWRKIGCGVAGMFVRRNPVFKNRGFWIYREDGSETDFSFEKCLRNKPESRLLKFKHACRGAIAERVIQFKTDFFNNHDQAVCPITGQEITPWNYHVDHSPPWTFDRIVHSFIRDFGIDVESVAIRGIGADRSLRNKLDSEIKAQFIAYHNERAQLRMLSPRGNLTLRKGGNHDHRETEPKAM